MLVEEDSVSAVLWLVIPPASQWFSGHFGALNLWTLTHWCQQSFKTQRNSVQAQRDPRGPSVTWGQTGLVIYLDLLHPCHYCFEDEWFSFIAIFSEHDYSRKGELVWKIDLGQSLHWANSYFQPSWSSGNNPTSASSEQPEKWYLSYTPSLPPLSLSRMEAENTVTQGTPFLNRDHFCLYETLKSLELRSMVLVKEKGTSRNKSKRSKTVETLLWSIFLEESLKNLGYGVETTANIKIKTYQGLTTKFLILLQQCC